MKAFYALGRLKTGQMNKTEAAYAAHLELLKAAGEVLWYKFEGIKLRLADNTFLTPDFAILDKSGELQLWDVKGGYITEDANAKMKIAADMYPMRFFIVKAKVKKDGGGWAVSEV